MMRTVYIAGQNRQKWRTRLYNIPLLKQDGMTILVQAMGMDVVTEELENMDNQLVVSLFPEVCIDALALPTGPVNLLVGIQVAEIHPIVTNEYSKVSVHSDRGPAHFVLGRHILAWVGTFWPGTTGLGPQYEVILKSEPAPS